MNLLKINHYRDQILKDLKRTENHDQDYPKDILIVVKDQLEVFQKCIESIKINTENYSLYIWNNASNEETTDYINSLDATIITSKSNQGFIVPNNRLIEKTKSPYIILLNSDTLIISPDWTKAMLAVLNEGYAQVGCAGSKLEEDLQGREAFFGEEVDYISGWCFCIPRKIYEKYGLFDEENLAFAYCEDSDFSLRLLEAGEKIYALHTDHVLHIGNKTINQVSKEQNVTISFNNNHLYMKKKWSKFLNDRKAKH